MGAEEHLLQRPTNGNWANNPAIQDGEGLTSSEEQSWPWQWLEMWPQNRRSSPPSRKCMPHNLWGKHFQTHEAESSWLQSNPHRYSSSEWSISAKSQDHLPIARTGSCTPLAARHPTVNQGTITTEINTLPTSQMEQWSPMGQTAGRKSWAQSSWSHTHLPVEKQHWKRRHRMLPTTWFPVPWWM